MSKNTPPHTETDGFTDTIARPEVWEAMTVEQQRKAIEIRRAIANGPLGERGVTEESLRVVEYEFRGSHHFVLIQTGPGIDLGDAQAGEDDRRSREAVMASDNDALFQVEVGGTVFDTRSGMTGRAYRASFKDSPSKLVIESMGEPTNKTLLTGEGLSGSGYAWYGYVDDDGPQSWIVTPIESDRSIRFCPAIEIE